jgi:hypothetical protein
MGLILDYHAASELQGRLGHAMELAKVAEAPIQRFRCRARIGAQNHISPMCGKEAGDPKICRHRRSTMWVEIRLRFARRGRSNTCTAFP